MSIDLIEDEVRMIIHALLMYEDQCNCGTEKDKTYFPRVLALASHLEAELAR